MRRIYAPLCLLLLLATSNALHAGGSRDLHPPDAEGDRVWIEYMTGGPNETAGITRLTTIEVYAQIGETLYLGSSAVGLNAGIIFYRDPAGTEFNCGADGLIANRAEELAGPQPLNPAGYAPCIVNVGMTGIWEVEFGSPNPINLGGPSNPAVTPADAPWLQNDPQNSVTAAWDVTVADALGAEIEGRVFTNYIAMNMGENGTPADPVALFATFYILTEDGYLYEVEFEAMNPFGFIFFSNSRGFTDAEGNALYRSVQLTDDDELIPPATIQDPGEPDAPGRATHKIFFNLPSPDLPEMVDGEWLLELDPVEPPVPQNLTFVGAEGTPNRARVGNGGTFSFVVPADFEGSYMLRLDTSGDPNNVAFDDPEDRIFFGTAQPGVNEVVWDGLDGLNNPVQPGLVPVQATLTLNGGEVHFPFFDVESNPVGIRVSRLSAVTGAPVPIDSTVYYDDSEIETLPEQIPTDPQVALTGIDSTNFVRDFGTTSDDLTDGYGNHRGIDTWATVPSQPATLNEGILIGETDLTITKTVAQDQILLGETVTYTVTVSNTGNLIADTIVRDEIELPNATWTCTPSNGASCTPNGSGSINDPVTLPAGSSLTYTIRAEADVEVCTTVSNTATVERPPDTSDPDLSNNVSDDAAVYIAPPPGSSCDSSASPPPTGTPEIEKSVGSPFGAPGDTVTYTITIRNASGAVTMVDTIPDAIEILSADATTGRVNVEGQQVTMTATDLNGSPVNVTITGRIRADTPTPFNLENTACLVESNICASASILSITTLPATGDSLWSAWRERQLFGQWSEQHTTR